MAYNAKVLADSISEAGDRLTTMEVTLPRIVLAEFNTHRMFSRNSASSRAIPPAKQIQRVLDDPFIPVYWGVNEKGMQATAELEGDDRQAALDKWLEARDAAVHYASNLAVMNVHKQTLNRLLEPFMWQTIIVTATEWSNFYALRANPDAQPEIRIAAEMMQAEHSTSQPTVLTNGEWHLPLIQPDERDGVFEKTLNARQISAARCARVSYLTQDGVRDYSADLTLYRRLVSGGHMSPLEHVATPFEYSETGYVFNDHGLSARVPRISPWSGNFHGWKQFRKTIVNENDFSKIAKG
ncbi:MAG TPA: FAD-dependent thymidylate synthase [Candidatus Saccharimonadales bacterium]|nr:FAD-dependent thymidylate synthase [Candidatus Saccharimonadales bacterium]